MIALDHINKDEAARYMGVRTVPAENISELLERCEKRVLEVIRPNYVYREVGLEFTENGVRAGDMKELLTGSDIASHLAGCTKAVLFAATLSAEADKLIRQAAVTDVAESFAIDCLCSAAVEQVCDAAEEEIFSVIEAPYRTWRFSPGYGDLPLGIQGSFLKMLNAQRRIGLTVTDSMLLIPSKSVTALIGISDAPVSRGKRGCGSCNMRENCAYRRGGKSCQVRT
ncbi:vitamin B12 dependent-methionine synthase activation domain-containing protein [uncultured Ruminococcus sp.]|uniref:vitamin B12 dependent-methionine synthase activation domain-containing protein n=1 Tax=uncultured Ruminococcus sp. TaxID=165186 RepID=UPI002615BC10|nr:vitamin B12 dependent-methionine synthase activation domain-containing protein [uncultured Ruminococcus sp.]